MVAAVDSWVPRDYVDDGPRHRLAKSTRRSPASCAARARSAWCSASFYAVGLTVDRAEFRHPDRPVRRADQLHPLCRLAGRAGARRRRRLRPVLAGLVHGSSRWPACSSSASSSRATSCSRSLVGKSVGLHPVWLMFALFAFGALFGFVGLLDRRAGLGGHRRAGALCHRPLSGIAALQGPATTRRRRRHGAARGGSKADA